MSTSAQVQPVETPPNAVLIPPVQGVRRAALCALIGGLIVAIALGLTLLTWALSLLFMLGLFFFMLFGLLVGAVMFRSAARYRPIPRRPVVVVTAIVALAAWATALGKEAHDFPNDFVNSALGTRQAERDRVYIPPNAGGFEQVRGELHAFIVAHMAEQYPPGGALGYLRCAAVGRPITVDIPSQPRKFSVPPRAAAWVWWMRGLLALPLFFITCYSVTAGLTRQATAAEMRRKY